MPQGNSPWIVEIGEREFEQVVLEQSKRAPVLVDFYAVWCGPCRQLTPTLERLAREYNGQFILVKVDIDQNPYLAMSLAIEVVPTVMAFKDGHLVGRFHGVLPEEQLRQFLDAVVPSRTQTQLTQLREWLRRDPQAALQQLDTLRQTQPDNEDIAALRALALAELGRWDEAVSEAQRVREGSAYFQQAANVLARVQFRDQAESSGGLARCLAEVQARPEDALAHYRLGVCLAAAGRFEEALQSLLRAGELNPQLAQSQVRETMVRIFHILGDDSDLANTYRSRLAALLY